MMYGENQGVPKYTVVDSAGGPVNYTADFNPNVGLAHNTLVGIKILTANTTNAPYFSPDGLTNRPMVNYNGGSIAVGQLAVGSFVLLRYDIPTTSWWVVNNTQTPIGRQALTPPSITFGSELISYGSFTLAMSANTTLTAPLTANVPTSGAWYIDITVDSTGGYTLSFTNSASVTWNQVYGYSFDCLPNGVYRLWMVARGSTILDVSMERLV